MSGVRALPKIGRNELNALREIAAHHNRHSLSRLCRPYYWRKASMQKLASHGYVFRDTAYGSDATPAWKITDAGLFFCRSAHDNLTTSTQD